MGDERNLFKLLMCKVQVPLVAAINEIRQHQQTSSQQDPLLQLLMICLQTQLQLATLPRPSLSPSPEVAPMAVPIATASSSLVQSDVAPLAVPIAAPITLPVSVQMAGSFKPYICEVRFSFVWIMIYVLYLQFCLKTYVSVSGISRHQRKKHKTQVQAAELQASNRCCRICNQSFANFASLEVI